MAHTQHLFLIAKGVHFWNKWRNENPFIRPDLSGADFTEKDFTDINLSNANLIRTIFFKSTLIRANLKGADLRNGSLIKANLQNADLSNTDLRGTQFVDYDGISANLMGVQLKEAKWLKPNEGRYITESGLELLTCENIEHVNFGDTNIFLKYIEDCFNYLHKDASLEDANYLPKFLEPAIRKIQILRGLINNSVIPPKELITVSNILTAELFNYLKNHPNALHSLRPRLFEELIAEILASYGWQIHLTQTTRDGGYDLFAVSKDLSGMQTSWIIECKKYSIENKVGIDIVRGLYGVKMDLRVANAMLATTSHFTEGVHKYKSSRYDLELRDFEEIIEWINHYCPNSDGKLYILDNRIQAPKMIIG